MYIYLLHVQIDGGWIFVVASFSVERLIQNADRLFGEALPEPLQWDKNGGCQTAALDYRVGSRHYQAVRVRQIVVDGEGDIDGLDTSYLATDVKKDKA